MKTVNTLLFVAMATIALAQNPTARNQHDPLFPAKGKFNAGIMTTYGGINPPPILIGDVTYGVSRKISVGIVGGTTGALGLYALKMNAKLHERNAFRLNARMISIYYPGRDGKFLFDRADKHIIPWMASMASVEGEWRTSKNVRWTIGVGGLETHCMLRLKKWLHGQIEDDIIPVDLFTTANVSVSIPVSRRLTIRPEVIAVFNSSGLIKRKEFMVSSPINPYLNLVYSF